MKRVVFVLLASSALFLSCEDEVNDPLIPNEEEVITTLTYTLTGAGSVHTFTFQDLDGAGGNAPMITVDTITSGVSYNGSLSLLNETESPAGNITAEIFAEAEEHQFFFQSSDLALSVSYSDTDANQQPLGLLSELSASDPGDYSLTITLRHEPDKSASGVSDGDITNAGGETDIEVIFQIHVL